MNDLIEEIENIASLKGFNIYHLDGKRIHNKTSFLNEVSERFKLPSYFGFNWDAFNDCITDLSWMNSNGTLIVFNDSEHFRIAAPDDWQTANNIFLEAIDYWKVNGKYFYLLLL
jgi:RNAse (barnase) inhibitor barstar